LVKNNLTVKKIGKLAVNFFTGNNLPGKFAALTSLINMLFTLIMKVFTININKIGTIDKFYVPIFVLFLSI